MKLSLRAEERANLTAWNGVATIPGKSKEVVIVNAHADAWFDGANDNADGLAVMLGLADYFAHRKEKPARTLVFMVSGGHHTAVGAAAFIKAHPEIIKDTVLVMNLEHLAQINVTQAARLDPAAPGGYAAGFWTANTTETTKQAGAVNATPYVWALMGKASQRYGVVTSYEPTPSAPGDLGSYIRAGLPSAQLISSEVYYHSSGDTPSTISVPGLERAAAFYAGFIDGVAKAPRGKLEGLRRPPAPLGGRQLPRATCDRSRLVQSRAVSWRNRRTSAGTSRSGRRVVIAPVGADHVAAGSSRALPIAAARCARRGVDGDDPLQPSDDLRGFQEVPRAGCCLRPQVAAQGQERLVPWPPPTWSGCGRSRAPDCPAARRRSPGRRARPRIRSQTALAAVPPSTEPVSGREQI